MAAAAAALLFNGPCLLLGLYCGANIYATMLLLRLRLFFIPLLLCCWKAAALWPMPSSISTGQDAILLSGDFSIQPNFTGVPRDLIDAINRTHGRLFSDKLGRLVVGRGSSDVGSIRNAKSLNTLSLALSSVNKTSGNEVKSISDEITDNFDTRIERESYSLDIPSDGRDALLTANTTLGLLRGLATFEQLWYTFNNQVYALSLPLNVVDKPAYVCSGLISEFLYH